MDEFLAIDIGGTTLKYALVRADGSIQPLGSLPTGAAMTRAELAQSLHTILNDPQTRSIRGIGISSLGIVDPQRGMVAPEWKICPPCRASVRGPFSMRRGSLSRSASSTTHPLSLIHI